MKESLRALLSTALGSLAACAAGAPSSQPEPDAGRDAFVPLFDGATLDGWVNVNTARDTWTVRDGMIVCSGKPTGVLRTARMYENFVLELDYRHLVAGGNAGLFLWSDGITAPGVPFTRSIEVQVLDGQETENYTSHGDVFAIHGARMTPDRPHPAGWMRSLPSERRALPAPEWNHYRVTCTNGTLKLAVNGAEVSGGFDIAPRKGYICLESEGSEVHFKDLRIRELPAGDAPLLPDSVAVADVGFRSLYNGADFTGWRSEPAHAGHFEARDWVIDFDGEGDSLWTREEFADFELIVDWRWSAAPVKKLVPEIRADGTVASDAQGSIVQVEVDDAGDSGIYLRGDTKPQINIWCWPIGSGEVYGYRSDEALPAEVRRACTPKVKADAPIGSWNRFHITLIGDSLTVVLNGETVVDSARLPGIASRGAIGLQKHGSPIQFANIYVREL